MIALTTHSICAKCDVIDHTADLIGTHDRVAGINAHFTAHHRAKNRPPSRRRPPPRGGPLPSSLKATALVGCSIDTTPQIGCTNAESTVIDARACCIVGKPGATARETTAASAQATGTTADLIATTRRPTTLNAEATATN